jgi:hypothetical protein
MSETKFMIYTLAAVFLLTFIHMFHDTIFTFYSPEYYVAIHTLLEFFSIAVSACIVIHGWRKFSRTQSSSFLLLSVIFFLTGMTDLFHTLSFKGMPDIFTTSSIPKATWFWIIARIIESIFILFFLLVPDRKIHLRARRWLFTISTIFLMITVLLVFSFETTLPTLVIEGKGTTTLKNQLEYLVSFLHFFAIIITLHRYHLLKQNHYLYCSLAFTFLFLSELVFTIYASIYDLYNFTGHIFKVIGYYFIMKGFLFERKVELGHEKIENKNEKWSNII